MTSQSIFRRGRLGTRLEKGGGHVVVSALDFRSEGRWFNAHRVVSLDKKLYPTLSLSTQVYKMSTGNTLLGVAF